jgi:hypothetical protein
VRDADSAPQTQREEAMDYLLVEEDIIAGWSADNARPESSHRVSFSSSPKSQVMRHLHW